MKPQNPLIGLLTDLKSSRTLGEGGSGPPLLTSEEILAARAKTLAKLGLPAPEVPPFTLLYPAGDVPDEPMGFIWTPLPGAQDYQIEVQGPKGNVLWQTTSTQTALLAPLEDLDLTNGQSYRWRVTTQLQSQRHFREASFKPLESAILSNLQKEIVMSDQKQTPDQKPSQTPQTTPIYKKPLFQAAAAAALVLGAASMFTSGGGDHAKTRGALMGGSLINQHDFNMRVNKHNKGGAILSWNAMPGAIDYTVKFFQTSSTPLQEVQVTDARLIVDLESFPLNNTPDAHETTYWQVIANRPGQSVQSRPALFQVSQPGKMVSQVNEQEPNYVVAGFTPDGAGHFKVFVSTSNPTMAQPQVLGIAGAAGAATLHAKSAGLWETDSMPLSSCGRAELPFQIVSGGERWPFISSGHTSQTAPSIAPGTVGTLSDHAPRIMLAGLRHYQCDNFEQVEPVALVYHPDGADQIERVDITIGTTVIPGGLTARNLTNENFFAHIPPDPHLRWFGLSHRLPNMPMPAGAHLVQMVAIDKQANESVMWPYVGEPCPPAAPGTDPGVLPSITLNSSVNGPIAVGAPVTLTPSSLKGQVGTIRWSVLSGAASPSTQTTNGLAPVTFIPADCSTLIVKASPINLVGTAGPEQTISVQVQKPYDRVRATVCLSGATFSGQLSSSNPGAQPVANGTDTCQSIDWTGDINHFDLRWSNNFGGRPFANFTFTYETYMGQTKISTSTTEMKQIVPGHDANVHKTFTVACNPVNN